VADGTRSGEVAEVYEDARPGYDPGLAASIAAYPTLERLGGGTVLDLRGFLVLARRARAAGRG
jgi:hypothetical protein